MQYEIQENVNSDIEVTYEFFKAKTALIIDHLLQDIKVCIIKQEGGTYKEIKEKEILEYTDNGDARWTNCIREQYIDDV